MFGVVRYNVFIRKYQVYHMYILSTRYTTNHASVQQCVANRCTDVPAWVPSRGRKHVPGTEYQV